MSEARPAESAPLPLTLAERVDRACDDLEAAWRAGREPRIEASLVGVPGAEHAAFLRELLAAELELRRARGEVPRPGDYIARFPGHAALIDGLFLEVNTPRAVSPFQFMKGVMTEPSSASAGRFPTTHWSRVARAGDPASPESRAALAELCSAYWYPIYALIRRSGRGPDEALDLTQGYFAHVLEKGALAAADHRKGRFRAFLRTDCGFFLSHEHGRGRAWKRGGGRAVLSIDARDAEGRYLREPTDDTTPERLFDRAWALNLLDAVLDRLAREHADTGRAAQFEALQGVLGGGSHAIPYAALAAQLGTTEGAVQQAVQRLRKRYRALLREEIAATLDEPDEAGIDDEIRCLFAALAR